MMIIRCRFVNNTPAYPMSMSIAPRKGGSIKLCGMYYKHITIDMTIVKVMT